MDGKNCNLCGEWRPLSEYHRHIRGSSGRSARCRDCANKIRRKLRADQVPAIAEYPIIDRIRYAAWV